MDELREHVARMTREFEELRNRVGKDDDRDKDKDKDDDDDR